MSARRLLATTVLAAATLTLTLTACDPTTPAAPASTAAAPAVTATAVTAPSASAPAKPATTSAKPTAKPSSSKPAADCTANAQHPGHKVINATVAWGSPDRIGANATKFVCGPDVDNDGYYAAVAPNTEYRFATGAHAVLLSGIEQKTVPLARLLQQINTCTGHPADATEYGCYGNMYDVTLDPSGKITTITALYHP